MYLQWWPKYEISQGIQTKFPYIDSWLDTGLPGSVLQKQESSFTGKQELKRKSKKNQLRSCTGSYEEKGKLQEKSVLQKPPEGIGTPFPYVPIYSPLPRLTAPEQPGSGGFMPQPIPQKGKSEPSLREVKVEAQKVRQAVLSDLVVPELCKCLLLKETKRPPVGPRWGNSAIVPTKVLRSASARVERWQEKGNQYRKNLRGAARCR